MYADLSGGIQVLRRIGWEGKYKPNKLGRGEIGNSREQGEYKSQSADVLEKTDDRENESLLAWKTNQKA